jgi:hypothetical protein
MSLIFTSSNYINNVQDEATVRQYVYGYSPNVQRLKIENANKIVVHLWGGGGGGGGAHSPGGTYAGAGGGGSFTILDFPYYPTRKEIFVEVFVGKGGNGGYFINSTYFEAEDGGTTVVYFKDGRGRILKEFTSYGGKGGKGNGSVAGNNNPVQIRKGGNGGSNTLVENYALMGAYYEQNAIQKFPQGGSITQPYGDHCQMNYLSVSGSGGGANTPIEAPNHGGSFILQKGGLGGETGSTVAGGGGSTYYGRGGTGGRQGSPVGGDGELNSGAGGGGSLSIYDINGDPGNYSRLRGGKGADGLVVIEVYH